MSQNIDYTTGAAPAQSRHLASWFRPIRLAELRVWLLLIACVSYWGNAMRVLSHEAEPGITMLLAAVLNAGAFPVVAWGLLATWWRDMSSSGAATPRQVAVGIAVGLLCAVPSRQTLICALVLLAWSLLRTPTATRARSGAMLLGYLAFDIVWTSPYMLPVHAIVAALDARFVSLLLRLLGTPATAHGNIIDNDAARFGVEVLSYCSSSYDLSGVGLAFLVVVLYRGRMPRMTDTWWIGAAVLFSIALTQVRLAIMAVGENWYFWMHDGVGGTFYTLLALMSAILFPVLATRYAASAR